MRSSETFERLREMSQGFTWHRCDHYFPLLDSQEDLETLVEMISVARRSEQGRELLKAFIRAKLDRAKYQLRYVAFLGGLRRGAPPKKEAIWELAVVLRQKDSRKWSWGKLAQKLDPDYRRNPSAARERMRRGVGAYRKRQKRTK